MIFPTMDNNFERVNNGKGQSSDHALPVRPSIDIRILVVDDDSTSLAIVASMLQIFNYKVETAKNPLDALAVLRMQNGFFDLVVTDLHMPYMNGFELKKQVDKEFKLPVIMMSADDKENVMLRCMQSGIVLYIQKPVNPEEIKDVWQFALRTKKGKSIMNEEKASQPNPPPPVADFAGDDKDNDIDENDDDDDDDNQGHQPLSGTGRPSAVAGVLIPVGNRPGERDNRSPRKDGNEKRSKSAKRPGRPARPPGALGCRRKPRRPKIVWTNSLHNRFLLAMKHLSFDKSVPKKILEFMNVPGLTRENVASHLQKYRLFLKKVSKDSVEGARMMANRVLLRSSFSAGYSTQIMIQNAEQLYPQPSRPSQPLLLPPPPQSQPQTSLAPDNSNKNIPSSSTLNSRSIGASTLLTNNQPATNNVGQQPLAGATNIHGTNGGGSNSRAIANNGGNNGVGGGVNPMQAWQQRSQVRATYLSNNNIAGTSSAQTVLNPNFTVGTNVGSAGIGNNYVAPNSSARITTNGGQMKMVGRNPTAGGGVLNRINCGGGRLGMVNDTGFISNMNGGTIGCGQMGQVGGGSSSVGPNNPQVKAATPRVVLNMNHRQQNIANVVLPPLPPPPPLPQLGQNPQHGSANLGRGSNNNNVGNELGRGSNNNNVGNELGRVTNNNVSMFGENGLLLNLDHNFPSPKHQAFIEAIHSDFSNFSIEDEHDQVNPPTNQIQNPDPSVAGPSRAQQNAPNLKQSLGLQLHGIEQALLSPAGNLFPSASEGYFPRLEIPNQQQCIEDLIYPHQIMNFENLHDQEVDWDEFMDVMLQDDIGSE